MGDGSDGGRADPGSSEECTRNVEHAEEDDVPVKAATLLALVQFDRLKIRKEVF